MWLLWGEVTAERVLMFEQPLLPSETGSHYLALPDPELFDLELTELCLTLEGPKKTSHEHRLRIGVNAYHASDKKTLFISSLH